MSSQIKVDNIESNSPPSSAVVLPYGATVSPGFALTCSGGMNISGVVTATSFSGDASNLTNIPGTTASKALAYKRIFHYDETYRA